MPKRAIPVKLGQKLWRIRTHFGFTLEQMANAIGLKNPSRRSRIHEWEAGKRQPDLTSLLRYARVAGITTDVLIDDEIELDLNDIAQDSIND
ncbi:MAG: hypothetical protein CUN57_01785 [Phototrophicales bacterium]|nr:MAG: hypothetical protein CUN57_01785 [Phototrophicales bacterium]